MTAPSIEMDDSYSARNTTRWGIIFAAWTLFGLAQTIIATILMGEYQATYILRTLVQFMPRVWLWALMTPLVAMMDQEARRRTGSMLLRIPIHFPFFVLCALLQTVLRRSVITIISDTGPVVPFWVTLFYFADIEAVRYVAALILGRVLEAGGELAKRERRAAALKEEIARAQLHYLDLQLQPHFLFNALGSISELAHEAPAAAARMVEHLTSLLRYATQAGAAQEVTLRQELDALYPYLEIQRMRFPDWLSISEKIEPEAADALVPRLLLQPLVENAIRHGLSNRRSGGLIEFRASVHGEHLVLSVYDNGAGLAEGKGGLGIGLANIRERLSTLYHDAQSLELVAHDQGGVEVLLRLPLRRTPSETSEPVVPESTLVDPASLNITSEFARVPEIAAVEKEPPAEKPTSALSMVSAWLVASVLMVASSFTYIYMRRPNAPDPTLEVLQRHAIYTGLWIGLTPIVIFLARRFPIQKGKLILALPVHLIASSAIAIGHLVAAGALDSGKRESFFEGLPIDYIYWNIVAYAIIVGITQRASIEGWIRERDVAAARMRAELTTARLSSVMLELRPDFLLSTLATLRTLVGINPALAETLLTSFADFLRMTLESLGKQKMPVERELALLYTYARLHRAGAGHFPEIDVETSPGLERVLVPTGLLRLLADRLLESSGLLDRVTVSLKRNGGTLTIRLMPANVNDMQIVSSPVGQRDPFRRLKRLTDSGAVIRFSEDTSSLEVDLPLNGGPGNAAEKTGPLALQYGIP